MLMISYLKDIHLLFFPVFEGWIFFITTKCTVVFLVVILIGNCVIRHTGIVV